MNISKQVAAIVSVVLSMVLIAAKVVVSIITGSLSVLAEAMDATLDLIGAGVTFLAVHVADRPPDDNHPYGHARADNLGALAQAILLIATASWIMWQASERLLVNPAVPTLNVWIFIVIALSLAVNLSRVVILNRATSQSRSQTLAASIANFTNDMIGSLAVLLALLLIALNPWLNLPPWLLQRLDALAAVFVAVLGLLAAWHLGLGAIRALMDDVPPDLNQRLISRVQELSDVIPESASVRTRFVGEQPYVEVTVGTPRGRSLEEAHQLADNVETVIRAELSEANVIVHVEPARINAEPYTTAIYSIAQRLGLRVHNLDMYQMADCVGIEMDLEVPGRLTLAEAHEHSEELEAAIRAELPCRTSVSVHLEPRRDDIQPAVRYAPIRQQVQQALTHLPDVDTSSILRIETLLTEVGIIVTLHCHFPGTTPLTDVHSSMVRIEQDLRQAMPSIARVQIDPEPSERIKQSGRIQADRIR